MVFCRRRYGSPRDDRIDICVERLAILDLHGPMSSEATLQAVAWSMTLFS